MAHDAPLTRDEELLSSPAPGNPASAREDAAWLDRVRTELFTRKVMFARYATACVVRRAYWAPMLARMSEAVLAGAKISPQGLQLISLADDSDEILAGVQTAVSRI